MLWQSKKSNKKSIFSLSRTSDISPVVSRWKMTSILCTIGLVLRQQGRLWFLLYGITSFLVPVRCWVSSANLMYRPPGRDYVKLADALDELYKRVNQLEKREFPQKRNFFIQLLTRWHWSLVKAASGKLFPLKRKHIKVTAKTPNFVKMDVVLAERHVEVKGDKYLRDSNHTKSSV